MCQVFYSHIVKICLELFKKDISSPYFNVENKRHKDKVTCP